jgi:hypothetical protein
MFMRADLKVSRGHPALAVVLVQRWMHWKTGQERAQVSQQHK